MTTACPPSEAPRLPPARHEPMLLEGRRLMRLFDVEGYASAAAQFREALMLSPRSASALAGLAETYSFWGYRREVAGEECQSYYDLAYASASAGLRLAPGMAEGHRAMSLSIRRGGRRDPNWAKREALIAVALDPNDGEAWHQSWRASGYDLADPAMLRAQQLAPSCALENDVGSALYEAGRLDEAASRFMAALRVNPRNSLVYWNLAMTLDQKGMRGAAIEVLRKARALHPREALLARGWDRLGGGASVFPEGA